MPNEQPIGKNPIFDPILDELMSQGAPFEVVTKMTQGGTLRVFRNAPDNMGEFFDKARQFGKAEFIISGQRRLSFDETFAHADRLSIALRKTFAVQRGQSVAICMQNCPEWMIAFIAIINAGGVAVLINSRDTGQIMSQAIIDADCVLVIADDKRISRLQRSNYDGLILPISEIQSLYPQSPKAESKTLSGTISEFTPLYAKSDDIAAMLFSSGTTGRAKAVAIDHRALITGMMNTQMAMAAIFHKMAKAYNIDVETLRAQMPQSCSLLVFPLFHTSGCSAIFLTALATGGKLVLMDRWDPSKALSVIESEKISSFGGVPTMFWDILHAPDFADYDLSSLRALSCGGQALPLNLLAQIQNTFPQAFIGAGYGMTETCGAISQANGDAFLANPSASGQVLPMVDVQIVDENGHALPIGEVGEIWVKGATLMQGYYGRAGDTARSKSGDWFKTGDIGRLDEAGYIYIIDRKTDMVISGGENIYCAEIEQILGQCDGVLALCAFGVADERLGERLVVCAQAKDGVGAEDIMIFARARLGAYAVPNDIIVQTTPFALNAMGKIEKHKIREIYLAQSLERAG